MYNRDMELLLERAIILQSVCYYKLVKIKEIIFEHILSPLLINKKQEEKILFEKMDNSKKTTVKLFTLQTLNLTCIGCKGKLREVVAYFKKIRNMKDNSLKGKTQSQISNPVSVLLLFVLQQVLYKS